ncbi:protein-L-isoaspartate(D-aspartate) O-methyltransferase [Haloarcula amylovorans]|uniref:protein-L-isoaspartate(D-aspartate) O-methyltransferase n=1 Tax=Haloarcula amylovorans TaxID=2562280 RepID=UPI0010760C89|nr:protein-L-isoaspartate(D-aspartate) O-methyltransferase [Halomicroarcula amylolytica]
MADWDPDRTVLVERLREAYDLDERVCSAVAAVPRHRFVPNSVRSSAYDDRPLPIGQDQTISAPHMVALMADRLSLEPGDRVLEIGTGCGYHAAVTAELVGAKNVYSVEYHDELAEQAREVLAATGYGDVSVRASDGKQGWADHAPYDRAYLTCAAPEFPDAVVEQVRPEGVLLAPIGTGRRQVLVSARRRADGTLEREKHGAVRFVPLQ